MCCQTWRLLASPEPDQPAISEMVRQQPWQKPVLACMTHTDTQGEGTFVGVANAISARALISLILFGSPLSHMLRYFMVSISMFAFGQQSPRHARTSGSIQVRAYVSARVDQRL